MKRNKFSLSNYKLFSANMGTLVPVGMYEALPGDTIQQATSVLVRCAPLVTPPMHPVHVRIHHWFVPYRLIWNDWENFITGGPDGLNASVFPTITHGGGTGLAVGSLGDYLGLTPGVNNLVGSALPFRAYALIWNEFYRDQDLETALTIDLTDGADTTTNVALQRVAWEKDYFTSSRPWEQKGPSITIPLGTDAPIYGKNMPFSAAASGNNFPQVRDAIGSSANLRTLVADSTLVYGNSSASGTGELRTDLTQASAVTVNVLREALALQRFEEARARYGSRYTEYLRYLGVRSSDARLQRPEYLGGGKQTIQFSEVLQTAEGTNPVGTLRGHGISAMRSNRYRRFFEEHGVVISLMSVRPKTMYVQGIPRHWSRTSKEDFWQRELETIGQQAVLNKEVYAAHATPNGTFGYQDRYDEYRRAESTIAGEFRSSVLDDWHFARIFASDPALNATFVSCDPPERPFASTSNDVLYCMARHSIQARRLLQRTGRSLTF